MLPLQGSSWPAVPQDRRWGRVASRGEHAYHHLAQLISAGALRAGDALPSERLLGHIFDIARGSLRMVLGRLRRDGVVRVSHGKSTLVIGTPLPLGAPFAATRSTSCMQQARHVIELARQLTSAFAVAPAPCWFDETGARRLALLVDLQRTARDLPQFMVVDRQFHAELAMHCQIQELEPLLRLAGALTHSALRDASEAQAVRQAIVEQHCAIVQAAERKDIGAAVATLCDQLEVRIAMHLAHERETHESDAGSTGPDLIPVLVRTC